METKISNWNNQKPDTSPGNYYVTAIDGRACFMAWGTVCAPDTYTKPGRLNAVLGMEVAA